MPDDLRRGGAAWHCQRTYTYEGAVRSGRVVARTYQIDRIPRDDAVEPTARARGPIEAHGIERTWPRLSADCGRAVGGSLACLPLVIKARFDLPLTAGAG